MKNVLQICAAVGMLLVKKTHGAWPLNEDGSVQLPAGIYASENVNGRARPAGEPGTCECLGICKARGDPHVTNVWGQRFTEKRLQFDLFDSDRHGLSVQADTRGQFFMETIRFNGTEISVKNCERQGYYLGSAEEATFTFTSSLDDLNVTMTVECNRPKNRRRFGSDFHLDVEMHIRSSQTMENVEAYGVCIEPHSDDGFDDNAEAPNDPKVLPECNCIARCTAEGDPHINTFASKKALLRDHELMIYSDNRDFEVTAEVTKRHFYMHKVTVKGRNDNNELETLEFDVEMCDALRMSNRRNQIIIGRFDFPAGPTGRVWGVVNCAQETEGRRQGTRYLDVHMNSNNVGAAQGESAVQNFLKIEAASGSFGACTEGNPFQ